MHDALLLTLVAFQCQGSLAAAESSTSAGADAVDQEANSL